MLGDKSEQRRADQAADLADQAPETEEPPARMGRRHVRAEHLHASRRNRLAGMHPEKNADKHHQAPMPLSVRREKIIRAPWTQSRAPSWSCVRSGPSDSRMIG